MKFMKNVILPIALLLVSVIIWFLIKPPKQVSISPLPKEEVGGEIKSLADLQKLVVKFDSSKSWDQTFCNRMLQSIDAFVNMKKGLSHDYANQLKKQILIKNASLFNIEVNNFISTANSANRSRITSLLAEAQRITKEVSIVSTTQNLNSLEDAFKQLSQVKGLFSIQYNQNKFDAIQNRVDSLLSVAHFSENTYLHSELRNCKSRRLQFKEAVKDWENDLALFRSEETDDVFFEVLKEKYNGYQYYLNEIGKIERERK